MITIAIPFYSNEVFLKRAIESVIDQTVAEWELVISLDSPLSDGFSEYLVSLNKYSIRVVENDIQGIANNWNNCVKAARSEYLTLLHSDDELMPDYVETIQDLIAQNPSASLYFCGVNIIDETSKHRFSFVDKVKDFLIPKRSMQNISGDEGTAGLFRGCYIFCPTICYKTQVIRENLFSVNWAMVLDLELYARLLFKGHVFSGTLKKAFRYRRHSQNQTKLLTANFKRFDEEVKLYEKVHHQAKQVGWSQTSQVAGKKTIVKLHVGFCILKWLMKGQFKTAVEATKYLWFLIFPTYSKKS